MVIGYASARTHVAPVFEPTLKSWLFSDVRYRDCRCVQHVSGLQDSGAPRASVSVVLSPCPVTHHRRASACAGVPSDGYARCSR